MRFLIAIMFFILLVDTSKAQLSFQGEYRMRQAINDSVSYNVTLKLNCNGAYIGGDSLQVVYGKWKIKNGDLILLADSTIVNNKNYHVNYKLVYENIDNRFYLKSVSKKEYLESIAEVRKVLPNIRESKNGYQKYKAEETAKYFEKILTYDCH